MIQITTKSGAQIEWPIQAVVVEHTLNRLATARIIILDRTILEKEFGASNDPNLAVGQSVNIRTTLDGAESDLFSGMIVKQNLRSSAQTGTLLCLELKHSAVKMSHARRSEVFIDKDENAIFQALVKRSQISMNSISLASKAAEKSIQYNVSDWDFLIMRAEANGLQIAADGDNLEIFAPSIATKTALSFRFGEDILELDAEIDARHQFENITTHTWDFESLKPSDTNAQKIGEINEQRTDPSRSDLSKSQGGDHAQLQHVGDHTVDEMKAWGNAQVMRSAFSRIRGRVSLNGNPDVKAGRTIEISGASNAFNGFHFVSAVRHEFTNGNWTTDVEIGLDQALYAAEFDVNEVPVSGLLAKMPGLQLGKVEQVKDDPRKQHRVKVSFVGLPEKHEGVWARVASIDAGERHGMLFRPQVGDEVLLGFLNEDPRDVIVLGSLFNGKKHQPPFNNKKGYPSQGIMTAAGLQLKFNEEEESILLETKRGEKIQLTGKKSGSQGIRLEDQYGNLIEMGKNGIKIKSSQKLSIEARADLSMKAMKIDGAANTGLKLEGKSTAEISSSGITTVKGSIVKIN